MEILWEEEGFQFDFKRWQGWAVFKLRSCWSEFQMWGPKQEKVRQPWVLRLYCLISSMRVSEEECNVRLCLYYLYFCRTQIEFHSFTWCSSSPMSKTVQKAWKLSNRLFLVCSHDTRKSIISVFGSTDTCYNVHLFSKALICIASE